MNWYYANAGQQVGPISDADFDGLVRAGTVKSDTLVWREGMANWEPYAKVSAGATAGTAPATIPGPAGTEANVATAEPTTVAGVAGGIVCSECGRVFPPDDVIRYGTVAVCGNCKPIFLQKLREGVAPVAAMDYAGFWIRFAATIVDTIILSVVNMMVGLIVGLLFQAAPPTPGNWGPFLVMQGVLLLINLAIGIAYEVGFLGRFGATPGKMACKIKVVRSTGAPISYARALGRYFAKLLSGLIFCIGYIMVAFDSEKRALHDRICDTRVIKNR
jgi:uncharacterized RDD family membrane protein YckC